MVRAVTGSIPAKSPVDVLREALPWVPDGYDQVDPDYEGPLRREALAALADVERLVEAASETARLYPYEGRLVREALARFAEEPS